MDSKYTVLVRFKNDEIYIQLTFHVKSSLLEVIHHCPQQPRADSQAKMRTLQKDWLISDDVPSIYYLIYRTCYRLIWQLPMRDWITFGRALMRGFWNFKPKNRCVKTFFATCIKVKFINLHIFFFIIYRRLGNNGSLSITRMERLILLLFIK